MARRLWLGSTFEIVPKPRSVNVGLSCLISLRTEVGSCGATLREVAREDGLNEGAKHYLCAATWSNVSKSKSSEEFGVGRTQSEEGPSTRREQI